MIVQVAKRIANIRFDPSQASPLLQLRGAKRIANILINPNQATLRITTIRFVLLFCLFIDKLQLRLRVHDLLAVIESKITGFQIADRHRNQEKRHTVKSK